MNPQKIVQASADAAEEMSREALRERRFIPPLKRGYERAWVKCVECGNVCFYDYVPYSLSSPIMTAPCGHGAGRFNATHKQISANEAVIALACS